jgi:hypothetical protein
MEEILLSALEAGASGGGDKRCGKQRATSAFITVIRADLPWCEPYLNLNVHHVQKGGPNAVAMVRGKYRRWKAHHRGGRSTSWAIAPPPWFTSADHDALRTLRKRLGAGMPTYVIFKRRQPEWRSAHGDDAPGRFETSDSTPIVVGRSVDPVSQRCAARMIAHPYCHKTNTSNV